MNNMKVGIPQGLLYAKYKVFINTFLEEIGAEIIISPKTNKRILDDGISCCVDEACLPIKVFHGHVSWLKDKCDVLLIPRFMGIEENKYICPMFCGLNDMIKHNIPQLPTVIDTPIYSIKSNGLMGWAKKAGRFITKDEKRILSAFDMARRGQLCTKTGLNDESYPLKVGLIGHTYNISDTFINMELKNKLNKLGIGVMTSDYIESDCIDLEVGKLFKRPFWSFACDYYGSAVNICKEGKADGIIYVSSFSCGIDSVVTELIKNEIDDFPMMILKLDEHTGEAGLDTRIEAFFEMLKRRRDKVGNHFS